MGAGKVCEHGTNALLQGEYFFFFFFFFFFFLFF